MIPDGWVAVATIVLTGTLALLVAWVGLLLEFDIGVLPVSYTHLILNGGLVVEAACAIFT